MKWITPFLLTFLFISNAVGQDAPRISKKMSYNISNPDEPWHFETIDYTYTISGKLSSAIVKRFLMNGDLFSWKGTFNVYDSNENLSQVIDSRYNWEVDLWIREFLIEYKYDEDQCLIEEHHSQEVGGLEWKIIYERDATCRVTKKSWFTKTINNDQFILMKMEELVYHDELSFDRSFYRRKAAGLVLEDITSFKFLVPGKYLEKHKTLFNDNGTILLEERKTYSYDDFGNVYSIKTEMRSPVLNEWDVRYEKVFENTYDQNGFLKGILQKSIAYVNPISIFSEIYNRYEYDCQGNELVNERLYFADSSSYRYEYFYEGKDECFDIENVLLEAHLFPNPSNGFLQIESPIFASGDTQILIFDMTGKVLFEKLELRRTEKIELDLTSLPSGMYTMQLKNSDHFITEKFMVVNAP